MTVLLLGTLVAEQPLTAQAQPTPETLIGGAVSDSGPYYQDLADAIARLGAGDMDGALAYASSARKRAPRLSPPEVLLANALVAFNQPAMARAQLEKAVRIYPQDPEAYLRLADLVAADGQTTAAGLLYAKALEVAEPFQDSPKRKRTVEIRAHSGSALIDESREQWAAARDQLQALEKLETDAAAQTALHQRLAKALFHLKDVTGAYKALQAIDASDAKAPSPEITMAALYNNAGDKAHAEKWVVQATKKGAHNLSAQIGLANWYLDAGDLAKARDFAEAAVKLDPQSADALLSRGIIARQTKDLKTAETALGAAHLLAPENAEIMNQLALVLVEKPDEASHRQAREFAELSARLNPNNLLTATTLAWVQYKSGKTAEAERLFLAIAARNQPTNNEGAYFLACLRKDQGRWSEAQRLLDAALSRNTPFYYRQAAEDLLAEVEKANGAASQAASEPRSKADEATPPAKADGPGQSNKKPSSSATPKK